MRSLFNATDVRDRGMGLVEVVVAVVLLGIVTTAVLAIVLQAQASTVNNRSRVAASNLAAREIDLVREQFDASITGPKDVVAAGVVINPHSFGPAGTPLIVDGNPYTVKRSATWNVSGPGASACEGGSLVKHPTLSVRVEVTWPDMGSTKPVVNTANLAPPKGVALADGNAFVAVKVDDALGQQNPGRTVTVYATPSGDSRTGVTDESGCAVIEIFPSAWGTDYEAKVSDAGHVDISGDPEPKRVVGRMKPGQLNASVKFAYDRAASLAVRLTGPGVRDGDIAGALISVYKGGGYSGSSPRTEHTVSGARAVIGGLWPGDYTAFFGATIPAELDYVTLPPGGSKSLDVTVTMGEIRVTDVPGDAILLAVPGSSATCSDGRARPVDAEATLLVPGTWSFFAKTRAYGCVIGPQGVTVQPEGNADLEWKLSNLRITGAPTSYGATIWAVSGDTANQACRGPRGDATAVRIGASPDASADLPAGDWYIFATDADGDAVNGADRCASAGLVRVDYDQDRSFAWPAAVPGVGGKS